MIRSDKWFKDFREFETDRYYTVPAVLHKHVRVYYTQCVVQKWPFKAEHNLRPVFIEHKLYVV